MNTARKDSAVHVSLSSYLIVKQQSLLKQMTGLPRQRACARRRKRPLPGYFHRVVFRPEELKRNDPPWPPKAALEAADRLIGRARSRCQLRFQKTPRKLRQGCPVAANLPTSPVTYQKLTTHIQPFGQPRARKVRHGPGEQISLQTRKRQEAREKELKITARHRADPGQGLNATLLKRHAEDSRAFLRGGRASVRQAVHTPAPSRRAFRSEGKINPRLAERQTRKRSLSP
jgi:hypothetical protein